MTKIAKKLQNPFLLAAQGFVMGAVLFFATSRPDDDQAFAAPSQAASASQSVNA